MVKSYVDWNGRREDSWGISVEARPRRSEATRRLAKRPPESEAPGVKIIANGRPEKLIPAFFFWLSLMKIYFRNSIINNSLKKLKR
jgi:hypothetical protein